MRWWLPLLLSIGCTGSWAPGVVVRAEAREVRGVATTGSGERRTTKWEHAVGVSLAWSAPGPVAPRRRRPRRAREDRPPTPCASVRACLWEARARGEAMRAIRRVMRERRER